MYSLSCVYMRRVVGSIIGIGNFPNSKLKIAAYPCYLCSNTLIVMLEKLKKVAGSSPGINVLTEKFVHKF